MLRICVVVAAVMAALATAGVPANAYPAPVSSGMSAEFPVGSCMNLSDDYTIDYTNIINIAPVTCDNPVRNYRVVAHVPNEPLCGPDTSRAFVTRDLVVLCTVVDSPIFRG
jgi:hypothetical protein